MLAEKLHMPVSRLREEMSQLEFMQWQMFDARRAQRQELEALKAKGGGRG